MESIVSKRRGRGQLFDEFVEGNLSIEDYTAQMGQKGGKATRRGVKRGPRDTLNQTVALPKDATRRLSEFFGNNSMISERKTELQGPRLILTDILAELEEEPMDSKISHNEEESKSRGQFSSINVDEARQTSLSKFVVNRKSRS